MDTAVEGAFSYLTLIRLMKIAHIQADRMHTSDQITVYRDGSLQKIRNQK